MKLWQKTDGDYREGKYLIVRRDGTIPNWPAFICGGNDPASSAALRAYADEADVLGYEAEYVASVRELADDFEQRARAVAGTVKVDPEAPPHRIDNPSVVAMMRGEADLSEYHAL